MNETDLHFFIDSTVNYFQEVTGENAVTGIPYLKSDDPIMLEYSGIIGISGKRKGCVYVTTKQTMLEALAHQILGIENPPSDTVKDLAGELANTISGNVREAYGSSFMISVPVVVEGQAKDIRIPDDVQAFVIPISWREFKFYLVVCLE